MVGIKVCPKCGSEDVALIGGGSHAMMCKECGHTGSSFPEKNIIGGGVGEEDIDDIHEIHEVDDYDGFEEMPAGKIVKAKVKPVKNVIKKTKTVKKNVKKTKGRKK